MRPTVHLPCKWGWIPQLSAPGLSFPIPNIVSWIDSLGALYSGSSGRAVVFPPIKITPAAGAVVEVTRLGVILIPQDMSF